MPRSDGNCLVRALLTSMGLNPEETVTVEHNNNRVEMARHVYERLKLHQVMKGHPRLWVPNLVPGDDQDQILQTIIAPPDQDGNYPWLDGQICLR